MTLKQLEAFYWAAILGSFADAAERLCVSQSSLSKRISELEADVGERLFDRSGARARSTDAGNRMLELARRMLDLEDEIRVRIKESEGLRGVCRFGLGEFGALTWLPTFVEHVRRRHPNVTLEPHVALARELESGISRGDLDFAVVPGASIDPTLASVPLKSVDLAWVCEPSRLPAGIALDHRQFESQPIISMASESGITIALDNWAASHDLRFSRIVASNSVTAVLALTIAGAGVSLLPTALVAPIVAGGGLTLLGCANELLPLPRLSYHLHWRKEDSRLLLQTLKQYLIEDVDFSRVNALRLGTG